MDKDQKLREQLVSLLKQGKAFNPMIDQLKSVHWKQTGKELQGFSHTIWEITEHIRLALHDLVEYSKDSYFQSPPWPEGYWPENSSPASEEEWKKSIEAIEKLMSEMINLVQNPENDLYEPFIANSEHNLLRQVTIAAEHTAYHAGQVAMLKAATARN